MRRCLASVLVGIVASSAGSSKGADKPPMPKVAEGWSIELVVQAPQVLFPTAIVAAPDGTIYLGQDPMDMPGPPTRPIDSVVAIKDGKVRTFAEGLWAVMGLEWIDNRLYVVHAPFLSAFTDTDGDGRADRRDDLMTGLGPRNPGFNGMNDHIASGVRLGIDGFLYIAVGDKGIPKGVGKDGTTISLKGGGVIRIRPDGTGLEVVSTGERNPLSVALSDRDDVFTYGNDDDSRRWPNSLTHQIVGGHYGYPYEFLTAPWRALPIMGGQLGGSGTQGICYNEDGLPARYRGNLFFCDWGTQTVTRYEIARDGGTFKVVKKEPFVTKGEVGDFRPFSLAVDADRSSLLLVDWAYTGWLADGPKTGRIYRLRYVGQDRVTTHQPSGNPATDLDHPALSVRRDAQRRLVKQGSTEIPSLIDRLGDDRVSTGRIHALWALDALGTPAGSSAIRSRLTDKDPEVRQQAARSAGIRRDKVSAPPLVSLLRDPDAAVRREAAIALGRLGAVGAGPALYAALGDKDPFVAWSVRIAIRRIGAWVVPELVAALKDPKRRDQALALADESWSIRAIEALVMAFPEEKDPGVRTRILVNLAGQYRKYPAWNGTWFGTNPLAGDFPARTVDWDAQAMAKVLDAIAAGLSDPDATVRREAIVGLSGVGPKVLPSLVAAIPKEPDEINRTAMVATIGRWADPRSVPMLGALMGDPRQPLSVRISALDALAGINSREAFNLRFTLLFEPSAPPDLIARALPPLGLTGALPPSDLAGFLEGKPKPVRVAALASFRAAYPRPISSDVQHAIIACVDDDDADVRKAAIEASGRLRLAGSIARLIERAGEEPTRAEATRALAAMPDPRALDVYVAALEDRSPELRKVGESALLAIRDRVAGEVEKRARSGKFAGSSALAVERVLTTFRPIVAWRVIGPFPRTTPQVFMAEPTIDFRKAHVGVEGRSIAWSPRTGDAKSGRVIIEDFKGGVGERGGFGYDTNGSPDLAAFAYAEVASDSDRDAILLFGSSGSVLATLNEKAVYSYTSFTGRAYAPDTDRVRVRLVKGTNRLLVMLRQGMGAWSFGVQVSDPRESIFAARSGTFTLEELRAFALNHTGDSRKGEELFFDAKGVGCVKCHSAGGRGTSNLGPDLTGLALKYDKAEIIRSVLDPSNRIATGFQPAIVARKDGSIVTGLVRSETEAWIEVVDAEAKVTRISKSEIDERKVGEVSIMPNGTVDTMTPVDFADLVAYLLSLKTPTRP
jgi:putative heme-binding domain-containing protein